MIPQKKDPRLDLDRYSFIFFLIGMVVSLSLVIWLLNIKFYQEPLPPQKVPEIVKVGEKDLIPITIRQLPKSTVKPLPTVEQFRVVNDNVQLDAELDLAITETEEDEMVIWNDAEATEVGEPNIVTVAVEEEENEDPLHFAVIETSPIFPGCEGEMDNEARKQCFQLKLMQHVHSNFEYPEEALEYNISGRIFIQFVLERNGCVSNVQIIRGVDPLLDKEAVRVVTQLPEMTPAMQRGKPVRMVFSMPIQAIANP